MDTTKEVERIAQALSGLSGVQSVTRGWPGQEAALPCIALQLAGERGVGRWDDTEYLTELEYYVRSFAKTARELDELAPSIREAMEALGYERNFAWEDVSEQTHQRVERYITVI